MIMIHGTKKWSTLTAAVLLAMSSLALPQTVWAAVTVLSGTNDNTGNAYADSNDDGDGTAVGYEAKGYLGGTAVGMNALTYGGVAIGAKSTASGVYATAIGINAEAEWNDSVAIGSKSHTIV